MTETIINLDTVNPIEFFGVNNSKFDILKKKFPLLKILSRGTQIKLSGAPEQIEQAKEKITLIIQYMERNGHLSENYFEQILGGDDAEVIDNFVDKNPNEVLVFGPNGKTVRARTANQKKMVTAADKNDIVFAIGPAGTGKTYTAVALAVRALKNKVVKKIILTRPAVGVEDERHGFLPGDLISKMEPWTRPLLDVLREYYNPREIVKMMDDQIIEISPLAYMRGRTFKSAWIIADEMQNATPGQMKMLLSRIGSGSKIVVTGDVEQTDRTAKENGLLDLCERLKAQNANGLCVSTLGKRDIQRHPIIDTVLGLYAE